MSEWKQDYAVLHCGDERYVRTLGRILKLTVERNYSDRNMWDARTHGFNNIGIFLKRKFGNKEDAMTALERKAVQLLHEALSELTVKEECDVEIPSTECSGYCGCKCHKQPSGTIPGNDARAETIAFCAAMLAMAGRLTQ